MTEIAEDSWTVEIPDHVVGPERTLLQAFNLWFNPETKRRVAAGTLKVPFHLQRAQVIFAEGKAPEVRFNEEVRGGMLVRASKAVEKGTPLTQSDITEVAGFELDLADADAGHFTIYEWDNGQSWRIFFNFLRNRQKAAGFVELADQFLAAAEFSLSHGNHGPFVDNLFSSAELLAKVQLITSAAESELVTHGAIHSKINRWRKLGNVDARFVDLFNELSKLRQPARYRGIGASTLKSDDPIGRVRAEIVRLRDRLKRFGD